MHMPGLRNPTARQRDDHATAPATLAHGSSDALRKERPCTRCSRRRTIATCMTSGYLRLALPRAVRRRRRRRVRHGAGAGDTRPRRRLHRAGHRHASELARPGHGQRRVARGGAGRHLHHAGARGRHHQQLRHRGRARQHFARWPAQHDGRARRWRLARQRTQDLRHRRAGAALPRHRRGVAAERRRATAANWSAPLSRAAHQVCRSKTPGAARSDCAAAATMR